MNKNEQTVRDYISKGIEVDWDCISFYQNLSEDFVREFKDKITFSRPSIIFNRDIKPYKPCDDGVERYLSHTKEDEEISWNTLLERHSNKCDIDWLIDTIQRSKNNV